MYLLAASERDVIGFFYFPFFFFFFLAIPTIICIIHTNFEVKREHFAVHVVHLLTQGYLYSFLLGLHWLDVYEKNFSCQKSEAFNLQT